MSEQLNEQQVNNTSAAENSGVSSAGTGELNRNDMMEADADGVMTNRPEYGVIDSFDEMGLPDDILRGIYSHGFEKPSAIQRRAIKPMMDGHDVIAQAQSGTGKTGTFSISTMSRVDLSRVVPQVLILTPTRELANQVFNVFSAISQFAGMKVHCLIGGTSRRDDEGVLREGVHVIIGTPGRVYDMMRSGHFKTADLKVFVLDEADEMLSRGFVDDIYYIFKEIPENVQVGLFSATMPPQALDITDNFMKNPVKIMVKREELTLDGILQYYVDVGHQDNKVDVLCDIYEQLNIAQSVIFCATSRKVDQVTNFMRKQDFTVAAIHGQMSHAERNEIMNGFRSGQIRFLISTDLTARGIDVQGVSFVVNYDLPNNIENYIHRIGRAGRYGRKGVAINLVTQDDIHLLTSIQKYYSTSIEPMPQNIRDLL